MSAIYRTIIVFVIITAICGCRQFGVVFLGYPPGSCYDSFKVNNQIDKIVINDLDEKNIAPSETCSDEVFIRRIYLDAAGTLPPPKDVKDFIADKDLKKRSKLIDKLLESKDFADYQAMKWSDLLRIKAEFPSNLWPQASQVYHRWVKESIYKNKPYNQFARELLTSNGSNFHVPPINFYRAFQERNPKDIASNVCLVFMGIRIDKAPYTEEQLSGLSAYFSKISYKNTDEWKEEIVYFNPDAKPDAKLNIPEKPVPLNGQPVNVEYGQDPRIMFADWLTAPENPWFAKNIVNRIWYWLIGRGIVHEPDNMNPPNMPSNPELLAFLEKELIANKYDLKHIYRLILNSNVYQLSSATNEWNIADESGFSHYLIRRLDSEVLIDAICQLTGVPERYSSGIPEPFTYLPTSERAVRIADGSISSSFLDMFGRSPRNTSFESEKTISSSLLQCQHMLNSGHIQKKIEQSQAIKKIINDKKGNDYIIQEFYVLILSRFPTADEKKVAEAYLSSNKRKPYDSAIDLAWALVNTKEFILKH